MKRFFLGAQLILILTAGFLITSCGEDPVILQTEELILTPSADGTLYRRDSGPNQLDTLYGAGGADYLRVGMTAENSYILRTLIRFDLSSLPANADIQRASLIFTVARVGGDAYQNVVYVNALTEDWTEGTSEDNCGSPCAGDATGNGDATWVRRSVDGDNWATAGGSFVAAASDSSIAINSNHFAFNNLADDVQAWLDGDQENFGWILKIRDEDILEADFSSQIRYWSNEGGGGISAKPRLVIEYYD